MALGAVYNVQQLFCTRLQYRSLLANRLGVSRSQASPATISRVCCVSRQASGHSAYTQLHTLSTDLHRQLTRMPRHRLSAHISISQSHFYVYELALRDTHCLSLGALLEHVCTCSHSLLLTFTSCALINSAECLIEIKSKPTEPSAAWRERTFAKTSTRVRIFEKQTKLRSIV